MEPQPRPEIFDIYWKFAAMRQEVFFNRLRNSPQPWTDDEIITKYKFCNAYRASDRVSQYLIKNVIYQGSQKSEEVFFRILLFKIFNKIETWQYLESKLEKIELQSFKFDNYSNLLQSAKDNGRVIYTSAYTSCPTKAFEYEKKHQNHLALIQKMVEDQIFKKIVSAKSLEAVFLTLFDYPLIGKFMAYQLATDINYSTLCDFEENSYTVAGPGAERGIRKCFIDTGGKSDAEIILWMTENQESQFQRLGIKFQSLWGRPLKAIDCQNLFCEVDKYCRAAYPELKSNRTRIKARFSANYQLIDYSYPPKWNINDKVKEDLTSRLPTVESPSQQEPGVQGKKKRREKPSDSTARERHL